MRNLKITTIVIEKDLKELGLIHSELKKIDELSIVGTATKGNKGFSLVINYSPDLVFINVDLQDINGIELVRILRKRNISTEVIFLGDNKQFAFESLEVEPFDFLIKPVNKESIQQMLLRLKTKLKKKELYRKMNLFTHLNSVPENRVFRQKGGVIIIQLEEIVYCKAELSKTILMLKCGEKVPLKSGISETVETINSEDFVRVGRSYCINRNFLRKIDKRNSKCHLYHEGKTWEVSTSKNSIGQLEKLNVSPMY